MSGVALAMRHRHLGLSTYGLNGQRQGDQHPRLCPFGAWNHLTYLYSYCQNLEKCARAFGQQYANCVLVAGRRQRDVL